VEFFQPLSVGSGFFAAPRLSLGRDAVNLYSQGERIAIYNVKSSLAALDLGYQMAQHGEIRLGVEGGHVKPTLDTGTNALPSGMTIRQGALTLSLLLDRLDSVDFPREGWLASAQIYDAQTALGADIPYTKWQAAGAFVQSFGENTFKLNASLGGSIGSNPLPAHDQFQWGGFLRQSGYAPGQLVGSTLEYASLQAYRRMARGGLFQGAYGGVSLETGRVGNPLIPGNPTGRLNSIGLFVGMDTLVGPVYLGYGRADDQTQSVYFYLGKMR
jgi:NTE family protein